MVKLHETPEAPGPPAACRGLHGPHHAGAPGKLKFPELSVIHKRSEKAIEFADD